MPSNLLLLAPAMLAIIIGLASVIIAMSGLGLRRTFGQEVQALRQAGLYGLTRNPQIVGYGLVIAGSALLWPSWYALGWVGLYAVIAHLMVVTEEEHLRRVHGKDYARYCERVPRYLGLPRR